MASNVTPEQPTETVGIDNCTIFDEPIENTQTSLQFTPIDGLQTWYVDASGSADFTTIQAAVNAAGVGDTIIVRDGTYTEYVQVNKSVILRTEHGSDSTGVHAVSSDHHVFDVTADGVTISGFGITGATGNMNGHRSSGISLQYANDCNISYNNVSQNDCGISLEINAHHNVLQNNTASSNEYYGIRLNSSSHNILIHNTAASNNNHGIRVRSHSENNTITENTVVSNNYGILLSDSDSNTVTCNTVNANTNGIALRASSSNLIYLNDVTGGSTNGWANDNINTWNSPEEIEYLHNGTYRRICLGNYWEDYSGTDADDDGIGDTPYNLSESQDTDTYPLMHAWSSGQFQKITSPVLTTIRVLPAQRDLSVGESCQFNATAHDHADTVMDGVLFIWTSSNEAVGTIDENGLFSACNPGTTNVSAANGSVSGLAKVVVSAIPEPSVITILKPIEDDVSSGNITVTGNVTDPAITNVTLVHNGVSSLVPVVDGNFSAVMNLTVVNTVTISAEDSGGVLRSATLLLDGDLLPGWYEEKIGFDPLDADSNCNKTDEDEAGNGVIDGYELLGGQLPACARYRIGADPFHEDTDGDGLTDTFELLSMGLLTDVNLVDTDGNGISDGDEDLDGDGLTNLEEQMHGTDPLQSDSDGDSLTDSEEIEVGTNPMLADSDGDGLDDDSELRIGTNPNDADSNGNGVPDGDEVYTTQKIDENLSVTVSVTGTGDLAKTLLIYNVTSPVYTGTPALAGPVVNLSFSDQSLNGSVVNGTVTLPFNASCVNSTADLSLFQFNSTIGTYEPVVSTVDATAQTITGNVTVPSTLAVFNATLWESLFVDPRTKQRMTMIAAADSGDGPWTIRITNLQTLNTHWFNGGAGFPPGVYRIHCSGSYNNAVLSSWIDWHIGAKPAWGDYGNLGMSVRYNKSGSAYSTTVSKVHVTSNVLQITHTGGKIGMWNHDSGILSDNYGDLTYSLEFASDIDTDGDGIPDWLEKAGWYDGFGNLHFTDPNSADSDGDGLTDSEEAGRMVTVDGKIYFVLVSDPNSVDGDGDGIDDIDELRKFYTNPLERDTDHDGLTDSYELRNDTDPTNPDSDGDGWIDGKDGEPRDPSTHAYSPQHAAAELVLGFTLGAYDEENHDNTYYQIGSSLSGFIFIGDIRDAGVYISQGDRQMAAVCLVGLVPGGGDGGKYIGKIARQFVDHPELVLKYEYRKIAVEAVRKNCPTEVEKIAALDKIYAGSGGSPGLGTRTVRDGVTADDVLDLVDDGTKKLTPTEILRVAKRGDGTALWLEEGTLKSAEGTALGTVYDVGGSGWIHIRNNHILYLGKNQFVEAFGSAYEDENRIRDLIMNCARTGLQDPEDSVVYWERIDADHFMKVVLGSNGYLRTAHPVSLGKVPDHVPGMFN
ncbi:NosD domain-containing protein [Methanofollis aquaemaris]|uniref:NosD domain-containing protein n=1 Tax=Methanofollis aquaemaris TaxID=126734 RepID=UPI00223FFFF3|nr:NosD domain-containing protein [Methanofollis aquaemaris]